MVERSILERYFNNTCSPAERKQVLAWLQDERYSDEVKAILSGLWHQFDPSQQADMQKQAPAFDRIREAIPELSGNGKHRSPRKSDKRRRDFWWYGVAAGIGFALTIAALLWLVPETGERDSYLTVYTEKGERKWVTLSDGSEIYLNADSRLVYPREMGMQQAAIYIEGEAFFNMIESDRPRIIRAGGVETRTGTESSQFNIKAFPTDSVVTVAVGDGRAEIRSESSPLLKLRMVEQPVDSVAPLTKLRPPKQVPMMKLRPALKMGRQEFAVVHKQHGDVDLFDALNEKEAFGWKDGILYFQDADARQVVHTLERWYGIEIEFCEEGQPERTYSAEFDNAQLTNVLAQLSQSLQLDYRKEGNSVYLCGK